MGKRGPSKLRKPDTEFVEFNGVTYAKRPHKRYFSTNRSDPVTRKLYTVFLHRAVWEFHNGPIPAGMDIHHKDNDPRNNAPGNLEAVSRAEHNRRHNAFAKWNASPESKAHRLLAIKRGWEKAEYRDYTCSYPHCGKCFKSRRVNAAPQFCQRLCWERNRDGVVPHKCSQCGHVRWRKSATIFCVSCRCPSSSSV